MTVLCHRLQALFPLYSYSSSFECLENLNLKNHNTNNKFVSNSMLFNCCFYFHLIFSLNKRKGKYISKKISMPVINIKYNQPWTIYFYGCKHKNSACYIVVTPHRHGWMDRRIDRKGLEWLCLRKWLWWGGTEWGKVNVLSLLQSKRVCFISVFDSLLENFTHFFRFSIVNLNFQVISFPLQIFSFNEKREWKNKKSK